MVTNEPNTTSEDEKTIERPNFGVFVSFFGRECTAVPQEVNEAYSDAAVNVQDQLMS